MAVLRGRNRELSHTMHFIPSRIEELTNKYPFATIYSYRNKHLCLFYFCHVTNFYTAWPLACLGFLSLLIKKNQLLAFLEVDLHTTPALFICKVTLLWP